LRWFYQWNLRRALGADALITVSESAREDILEHSSAVDSRLTAIPNGVNFPPNDDVEPLRRLQIQEPYVLYAGSYEPRKNLVGMFSAFKRLVDDGRPHQLVAIVEGASGHEPAVRAQLDQPGIGGRVRLLHGLRESDLRAVYTRADLLCFPSLAEGFGFPPLQAAQCGTPVVASDIPAVRESLATHAAYIRDPASTESIADAVRLVLDDRALREGMVAGAVGRAREYRWERAARSHLDVYESAAGVSTRSQRVASIV
jgi:glycosyltransferase involved in cell wall biosynthesis